MSYTIITVLHDSRAELAALLDSLDRHYKTPYHSGRPSGLVIGYGSARPGDLKTGCGVVRDLLVTG